MAIRQSKWAAGLLNVPYPSYAGHLVAVRFSFVFLAAQLVLNDIIELACLPAGCSLFGATLDSDDLDTGGSPAVSFDLGLMSGDWGDPSQSRTVGAELFSGTTVARAGGLDRPVLASAWRIAPAAKPRSIGLKIAAAPATAAGGEVGLSLHYATQ